MGSSKQLSKDLKTKIVESPGLGEGYKKPSQRFKLSVSTVRNGIRNWKATVTVAVKPSRSGRPRKIQEWHMSRIVRMVTDNPQITSTDLQEHVSADGVSVHRSTIQHNLHKEHLYGRVMRKKPFLHSPHKQSRLLYANAHVDKPDSLWNKVLWTDETKMELFGHNKKCFAWQKNTAFQEKHLLPTVKFGGGSIMLWCCVASSGTEALVKVEGQMNSTQYQQILQHNVQASVTKLKLHRGWIFQQDNDPKHSWKSTKAFMRRRSTMLWNGRHSPLT
uniref:Transposase Tc1-like domain-containing protein n=1 Tax=Erpetoichthys calabaricus TaxID=27687 RepID=A0A8C4RKI3_ERPCA